MKSPLKAENKATPVVNTLFIFAVFIAHFSAGLILYRGRAISKWIISDTDLVVFALPLTLAAIGYFYAFRRILWFRNRRAGNILASLVASLMSWFVYMLVALNTYGS
jgi:hypothetical protein